MRLAALQHSGVRNWWSLYPCRWIHVVHHLWSKFTPWKQSITPHTASYSNQSPFGWGTVHQAAFNENAATWNLVLQLRVQLQQVKKLANGPSKWPSAGSTSPTRTAKDFCLVGELSQVHTYHISLQLQYIQHMACFSSCNNIAYIQRTSTAVNDVGLLMLTVLHKIHPSPDIQICLCIDGDVVAEAMGSCKTATVVPLLGPIEATRYNTGCWITHHIYLITDIQYWCTYMYLACLDQSTEVLRKQNRNSMRLAAVKTWRPCRWPFLFIQVSAQRAGRQRQEFLSRAQWPWLKRDAVNIDSHVGSFGAKNIPIRCLGINHWSFILEILWQFQI